VKNKTFRFGMSLVTVTSLASAWACFGSSNSTPTGTGTGTGTGQNTGGTGGTSTSTGGSSSGSSDASGVACVSSTATGFTAGPILDDMTNNESETGGSWYTYSSRSVPNSEPPILTSDAGTLTPPEGQNFPFASFGITNPAVPALPASVGMGDEVAPGYREFSGNGIPEWGAGFGMDLTSYPPDGSAVAFNSCPPVTGLPDGAMLFNTTPTLTNTGIPQPFDASAYAGFSFWAISLTGKSIKLYVQVDDASTAPWGNSVPVSATPTSPLRCDVCKSSGTCSASTTEAGTKDCPCSDSFRYEVQFSTCWKQFYVKFSDLAVQDWSMEGALVFDPAHVYNIHFQDTINTGTTPAFDVAVAYLQWAAQ